HGTRSGRRVERPVHRRHRGAVTQPGAVVHAVGPECAPDHPHERIVVLIAALCRRERAQSARPVLIANPQDLLCGETQRLFPGCLPEGAVPARGRSHAVSHVIIAQPRNPGERRLADLAERWPGLLPLAHLLDGEPGPFPAPGPLTGPDPAAVLEHPTLANERRGEPVPVLGKVVAKTSFDAGRALVGRGLLDPGRGDPHDSVVLDVKIELTSHGAVRTHRPDHPVRFAERVTAETLSGNELEDGAGGTDSHAL